MTIGTESRRPRPPAHRGDGGWRSGPLPSRRERRSHLSPRPRHKQQSHL